MSNRNLKKKSANVLMKTDTTEHWKMCEEKYIPALNTIIVYQDTNTLPRIKISDGVHKLGELPFLNDFQLNQNQNINTRTKENPPHPIVDGDLLEFKY